MQKLLLLFALFLSACSSTQYSLAPVEEPTFWNQGIGYNQRTQGAVTYGVGSGEVVYEGLQFSVQIENKGTKDVNIDSKLFTLQTGNDLVPADNPETIIAAIDSEMRRRKTMNDPLGLNIIGTIADVGNNSKEAQERRKTSDENDKSLAADLQEMQLRKDKISTRFFRRTNLKPGQSASGIVQFSINTGQRKTGQLVAFKNTVSRDSSKDVVFRIVEK